MDCGNSAAGVLYFNEYKRLYWQAARRNGLHINKNGVPAITAEEPETKDGGENENQ
jgi:hypothetical protein